MDFSKNDSRIIEKSYRNNTSRRKVAEALFTKKMKHSVNIQEKSVKLELFNKCVSETLFIGNLCYMETSILICIFYQLAVYYVIQVFMERCF